VHSNAASSRRNTPVLSSAGSRPSARTDPLPVPVPWGDQQYGAVAPGPQAQPPQPPQPSNEALFIVGAQGDTAQRCVLGVRACLRACAFLVLCVCVVRVRAYVLVRAWRCFRRKKKRFALARTRTLLQVHRQQLHAQ